MLSISAGRKGLAEEAFTLACIGRYQDLENADLLKLSTADHMRLVRKADYLHGRVTALK